MKIKPALHFAIKDNIKALIIYYCIIVSINIFLLILTKLTSGQGEFNGMDLSSSIFMLVLGITNFRQTFLFLIQHGRSRKTLFTSTGLAIIIIAALMSLADVIITAIFKVSSSLFQFESETIAFVNMVYQHQGFQLLQLFFSYSMFGLTGLFIGAIYYRMTLFPKIIVSAGVPILLLIVLPIIDFNFNTNIFIYTIHIAALVFYGISDWYLVSSSLSLTLIRAIIVVVGVAIYYASTVRVKVKA